MTNVLCPAILGAGRAGAVADEQVHDGASRLLATARFEMRRHVLPDGHLFYSGAMPADLALDEQRFHTLWDMQPDVYDQIMIHGRPVKLPRKQQAYEYDYHFTGRDSKALPVPSLITPLLVWSQTTIDPRLNGLLVNWYDGRLKHYIGPHRDSTVNLALGSPIVTLSFGEERVFRLRPWKRKESYHDFQADNGTVFVTPFETNQAWTHEVPHFARNRGRRISVTLRVFEMDQTH